MNDPVATLANGTRVMEGEPQRTHPLGFLLRAISGLGNAILPIAAVIYTSDDWGLGLIGIFLVGLVIIAISSFFAWLSWWRLTYTIGEEDIRVESGVLSRQARSVPYERIQDVSLEQQLLARIFGLSEVRFETGAGGKDELKLAWVKTEEGERMRELVRERKDESEGIAAGLAAASDDAEAVAAHAGPPIFAMDTQRIFTFGLFEFSLVIFAVLLGAAQQFDFLIPFDMFGFEDFDDLFEERGREFISGWGMIGTIFAVLSSVVGIALVGVATGMVRTFLREWGYRLDRTEKGFRRRRGMLTLTDVVLPVHRVQGAIVATGWLRKRFGWHSLKFVSLARDSGGGGSSHDVVPFGKLDEIRPVAKEAAIALPGADLEWHRPIMWRWLWEAVFGSVFIALAVAGMLYAGLGGYSLFLLLLIPLFLAFDWLSWRRHFFAVDEHQIYTREGIFRPKMRIAPRTKLQSVDTRRGPIGKLAGYVDLHFGLAGGGIAMAGLAPEQAEAIRAQVIESIAAVDFSDLPR